MTRSLLAIFAAATAIVLAVGPSGDFPLSDDWSYAYAVEGLCRDGELRMLPWTGASLIFQAAYGAALCVLFGPSFEILRASTILLAVSAICAFAMLLRDLRLPPAARALAIVTVGLSPLYINLSFTFMTDVPFTALCLWAAFFYVRGLGDPEQSRALIAGAALATAALLVRQHGIFVAAAASIACLWPGVGSAENSTTRPLPRRFVDAVIAGALPAAAFIAFHVWLFAFRGAPAGVENKVSEAAGTGWVELGNLSFRALEYLGLLLVPVAIAQARMIARTHRTPLIVSATLLGGCVLFLYLRDGELMFYLTNVLHDFGLGALTLRDTLFLGKPPLLHLGIGFSIALTAIATASAGVLIASWTNAMPELRNAPKAFIVFCFLLLAASSLLHAAFYFDRYLLPVLPFAAAAALIGLAPGRSAPAAWIAAGLLGWWAVAGTHDSMEWNRARYAALSDLEEKGVSPREIDGGMEYNAWRLAAALGTWPTKEEARPGKPESALSWWWVVDDRYILSFRPLDGYNVHRSMDFRRWLIPGTGQVLVLERDRGKPS